MPPPRALLTRLSHLSRPTITAFSTSPSHPQKRMASNSNPQANQPNSPNATVRKDTPNTDAQSSSSRDEHKSGAEHPAKQPDPQATPERKTGIGGGTGVEGGSGGETKT
ncbi:hypothetical protein CC80DRAFT_552771 [Byssothecium circinans]|uniref:Uncharacterized protein n=1 Tax=Byssothecium circinans TaxID=147558 RepID=A0A6A5TMI8_9PLEO|nr:hypothetical protein CC80DRAFT_552771 [Byssothecium circinans]